MTTVRIEKIKDLPLSEEVLEYEEECEEDCEEYEECEERLVDTVIQIRDRLFKYTENGMYPLCEFLDYENVANYVQWLLKQSF